MIKAISSVNISFKGGNSNSVPVTQKHIDMLTGINGNLITELDNMGLINKTMLQRVKKAAAQQDARIASKSVDTVLDIIKHPRYLIEQRDNGYWFETESKYDFRELVQNYANGEHYSTPIFSRAREYADALENITKKASVADLKRLEKLVKE